MDTSTLLMIVLAVIVIAVIVGAVLVVSGRRQTTGLKEQFGDEYEHAVHEYGDPHKAEANLQARQKRVDAFNIRPLEPAERERFANEWKQTQAHFVDAPEQAVTEADRLVKQVMQQRGYPMGDFDQQAADISVDHPTVVTHYRAAHEIVLTQEKGKATTEELRQAMVHYRALFEDLLQPDLVANVKQDKAKV